MFRPGPGGETPVAHACGLSFARPGLLIHVPGHMRVGVEMRPGSSGASGWFEYVLIEPNRSEADQGRFRLSDS